MTTLDPSALRASGTSPPARALADALGELDEGAWAALLPELRALARAQARRYADVGSADDALGELALRAWDGWLEEWARRVRDGGERRSLWTFLGNRLRAHLRELRRREARRRQLLAPLGSDDPEAPLFAKPPPRPDEALEAVELRASIGVDEQARALVLLRESGFSQREIADALGVSRPTVTRRLAAVSAAVAALLAIAALAWWAWPRGAGPVEIHPEPTTPPAAEPKPAEPDKHLTIHLDTVPGDVRVFDWMRGTFLGVTPIDLPRPEPGQPAVEYLLRAPDGAERVFSVGHRTQPEITLTVEAPIGSAASRRDPSVEPAPAPERPWWDRRR